MAKTTASGPAKRKNATTRAKTKKQTIIDMLKRSKGASLAQLQKATGWQAHSVRGFLSGTVKKMTDVNLVTEKTESGTRRYRIEAKKAA